MNSNINVCQIISGDIWGGAEAQAYSLLKELIKDSNISPSAIIFNDGLLSSKIRSCPIPHEIVNETTDNPVRIIRAIYSFLKNNEVDIIHVHGFKETLLGGVAARLLRKKVKIIRTFHGQGLTNSSFKHKVIDRLNAYFFSDQLITVSEDLEKFLLNCGINDSILQVVHNGVAVDETRPTEKKELIKAAFGIPKDAFVIGTLGRMVPVKGHDYFLQGAKEIIAKKPDVYFVICGGGPLLERSQEWLSSENLNDNIKIIGFRKDPYNIINCFDIFALTSLHEGIPMVLLEAMFLGKPIVTTAVGGIPEFIVNNTTGITIPAKSVADFSAACLELLKNDSLRESLARNGQKVVLGNYTASINATAVKNIYLKVL